MDIKDATALLTHPLFKRNMPQTWADLGCGNGTFTIALANRLVAQSSIYAMDVDANALSGLPSTHNKIQIQTTIGDFAKDSLGPLPFNGIMMANSFHYVKDKYSFLEKIRAALAMNGTIVFVEYDTDIAVPKWVPYPCNFLSLQSLFKKSGFGKVEKMNERKSVFGGNMYTAIVNI